MSGTSERPTVGVVGLGIMGSSYARNLREAGFPVIGFDVAEAPLKALKEQGGEIAASPKELAAKADVILIALASVDALKSACGGESGMIHSIRSGTVVCEMGTLPMYAKDYVLKLFEPKGVPVLDCPVSGTGAQAAVRDLVVYASGDEAAATRIRPVFDGFARNTRYVGAFGAGIKLKFVANLLVTIHNLATAEALLMAEQSGLDLNMVFDAIRDGAGNSRMFEVRGPMMIEERYQPATMKMDVYMKDLTLITEFARDIRTPTPLMAASVPFYVAALAAGRDADDTAALYAVLKEMTQKK
ncbi:NAD(P)-dependent oxidoreductase [Aquabacter sp. CN5-332]|uniref:NAD(P)-dependent oxidoreductase n=1 Tax=Aquabacter sp. CN5-332 TaxID=3156608 RepID=UPI0032B4CFE8